MKEIFYLVSGIILLVLVISDFFYTTLSVSGAGKVTKAVTIPTHKFIHLLVRLKGRGAFRFSGMILSVVVVSAWIAVVWLGLFLVFSFDPAGITGSNGEIADSWERLYYTGYTLSTLGMGDFTPTTNLFKILTSFFSFFGFIFFTSSMTYLLSVSSAVINKRTLARTIYNLGRTPQSLARKFRELDTSYGFQQILSLQEMVDRHFVNHQAYPVLYYYSHPETKVSLSINLTRLDEAINILLHPSTGPAEKLHTELELLQGSITHFLNHIHENYSHTLPIKEQPSEPPPLPYEIPNADREKLQYRRKILGGFLKSEHFDWKDVSPPNK